MRPITGARSSPSLLLLGGVQVHAADGPIPLGRRRMHALVALLALEPGRERSTESLAADLEPDVDAAPLPAASVRAYISRLRSRLEATDGRVALPDATEGGYRITADLVDHVELQRLAQSAERRSRARDLRGAVQMADQGLALWRGRPFGDLDLPALELHRVELEATRLRLEDLRLGVLLRLGEHEQALADIEAAVQREPLREQRTAFLMLARYRSGRQRDALAAVQALRAGLADAGLDQPVPTVQDLEAQILAQDPQLDWAGLPIDLAAPDRLPPSATTTRADGGAWASRAGPATGRRRRSASSFIGRRAELDALIEAYVEASTGTGGVALVAGEAGIGKTRLVEELSGRAEGQGASVHWGRCFEAEATAAHRPVVAVLRSLLEARPEWWAASEMGPREADICLLLPELRAVLTPPRAQAVQGDELLRARDAAARWVVLAARDQPIVLVFEDLHWADRASLLLLGHLARHTVDEAVLLVGTFRPEEVAGRPLAEFLSALGDDRPVARVDLGGLDEAEVAALAEATTGVPCQMAEALVARTTGNPLFVREIARHLGESADQASRALPDSVLAVLDRRLGRMDAEVVDLVRVVAASPGGAPLELLSATSGRGGQDLVDDLELAIDAGVLKEQDENGTTVVDVAHPLFRDAAYQRLSAARRAQLHDRLAGGLEPMAQRDPEHWLGELAHHAHLSGPTGDAPRAFRASRAAGELAARRTAYELAVTHLSHALDALARCPDPGAGERARLQLACAQAHHRAGASDGRIEAASAAFAAAAVTGDWAVAAEAALIHGGTRSTYGQASEATVELLDRAREALRRSADPATVGLQARVTARLAQESYHVGRYDRAEALSAEAGDLARSTADDGVMAACAEGQVWALYHPDQASARLALTSEMVDRAARADEREWEMLALVWRASTCLELGRIADIDRDLARLSDLSEVVQAPSHLFRAATMTATRAIMSGRYDEGPVLAEAARQVGIDIEPENADHTFAAQLLGMLREQGALAGLLPMVEGLADRYRATPGWRCGLAWAFLQAGERDRAREELDVLAVDGFTSIPFDLAWVQAHTYLAETASVLGDRDRGAVLYERLAPYDGLNANIMDIVSNGAVSHYLGLLAALMDDERAEGHLRAAVAFNDATDQRPAAARSRLELARVLMFSGDPTPEVAGLLAEASSAAEALGLVQLTDDVRWLQHSDAGPAIAPA